MKVLFVCEHNRLRSPTAAAVFAHWPGIEVRSAGLNALAVSVLTEADVEWADLVLCMEREQRVEMRKRWPSAVACTRVVPIEIEDEYEFMQPELVALLQERVPIYLPKH